MKKWLVGVVAAASLTGGAVAFAMVAPVGIASAQGGTQQQTTPDPTTQTAPKTKPLRRAALRKLIKQRGVTRDEIATYLGITPDVLKQDLQSGKSLADIAGAKTQGLVDMLTAKADDRIEAALAANKIDASRAATLKTKAVTVIERLVNAKRHPAGS